MTCTKAAELLKKSPRTVAMHCKKLGCKKVNNKYDIGHDMLEKLKKSIKETPGPRCKEKYTGRGKYQHNYYMKVTKEKRRKRV